MLYSEFRTKTVKLINQFTASGNPIALTDSAVADQVLRLPDFADTAQKEIATTAKYIHKKKSISQNPIPNMLSNPLYMFDVQQHLSSDLVDMTAVGAQSYYFEVDNVATIYIEELINGVWTILQTISNSTTKGDYTPYYGFISASSLLNSIRIRFSGSYPYNVRNKALYEYLFPTTTDIPVYQRYIKYTLPSDFYQLNRVLYKGNSLAYSNTIDWEFEGRNTIAVNYFLVGEIDILYYAYPATIDSTVLDTYKFEVDEEAAQAIPYYAAAQVLMDDPVNKSVSDKLMALYQGKLANLSNTITQGSTSVKNSMFVSDGTNKLF